MISEETLHALEFDRVRKIAAEGAASSLGQERLLSLLPFASAAEAEQCMMRTGEMLRIVSAGDFPIHGLEDIREELQRAAVAGSALEPEQLLHIAATASAATEVKSFLSTRRQASPLLAEIAIGIADVKDIAQKITRAIEHDGTVKDDASHELKKIRQAIRSETRALEEKTQGLLQRWSDKGYLQDSVISYRAGRLTLPVKGEMRGRVQGMIVDQSGSGATVFMEPVETLELSNKLRQLEIEEHREVHRILLELTAFVHDRREEFESTLVVLAELDELYARARLALRWEATDVALSDRGRVRILRGRHPLLIERLKKDVVPLSMEIVPPLYALVISGPNAGGKTVVLKTIGLFAVMSSAGLFLPVAPGSEIPFFTGIHADIGDAQSIESDLSTFTAHIARLKRMVEDNSQPKMILVDEIGSSTDPALGSALAQAVLLELVRQQAVAVVTTHHGTLKAFAHETDGIENGSMAFDENSLVPTYVFRPGLPGSSYALEIAERVGFPKDILETARGFLAPGMLGLEQLVSELTHKIEEYEKLRRESDLKLNEYAALQKLYAERTRQIRKLEAEVKAKATAEAEAIIEKAGREMEAAIRGIKKEKASREAVKSARETIITVREEVEKKKEEAQKTLDEDKPKIPALEFVSVGDRVMIESFEGIGTVMSVQKGGRRAEVEIGGVRLWTDANRLIAPPESERKKKAPRVKMDFALESRYVAESIDLRGKYGDEAIAEVDSYLAAVVESNLKQVTIIHGKGTGALRTKIHHFLNTHPLVKSYHDGGRNNDDFGCTVVEVA